VPACKSAGAICGARLHDGNRHVALAAIEHVACGVFAERIANVACGSSGLQGKQSPSADKSLCIRRRGGTLFSSLLLNSVGSM
jgi:hypothetical protein